MSPERKKQEMTRIFDLLLFYETFYKTRLTRSEKSKIMGLMSASLENGTGLFKVYDFTINTDELVRMCPWKDAKLPKKVAREVYKKETIFLALRYLFTSFIHFVIKDIVINGTVFKFPVGKLMRFEVELREQSISNEYLKRAGDESVYRRADLRKTQNKLPMVVCKWLTQRNEVRQRVLKIDNIWYQKLIEKFNYSTEQTKRPRTFDEYFEVWSKNHQQVYLAGLRRFFIKMFEQIDILLTRQQEINLSFGKYKLYLLKDSSLYLNSISLYVKRIKDIREKREERMLTKLKNRTYIKNRKYEIAKYV